jgi:hypothetical protein
VGLGRSASLSALAGPCARSAGVSVTVVHDVDDVAVRCSDEESAYAPRLGRYRLHDLVSEILGFLVGTFDVVGVTEMTESSGAVASRVTSWTFAFVGGAVATRIPSTRASATSTEESPTPSAFPRQGPAHSRRDRPAARPRPARRTLVVGRFSVRIRASAPLLTWIGTQSEASQG